MLIFCLLKTVGGRAAMRKIVLKVKNELDFSLVYQKFELIFEGLKTMGGGGRAAI